MLKQKFNVEVLTYDYFSGLTKEQFFFDTLEDAEAFYNTQEATEAYFDAYAKSVKRPYLVNVLKDLKHTQEFFPSTPEDEDRDMSF